MGVEDGTGATGGDHGTSVRMKSWSPAELDALYREAVSLADRARGWFDGQGVAWRNALPARARAAVATESLATTARLMAVIAWSLDRGHAVGDADRPGFAFQLGTALAGANALANSPGAEIVEASRRLVARIAERASAQGSASASTTAVPGEEIAPRQAKDIDGIWRR